MTEVKAKLLFDVYIVDKSSLAAKLRKIVDISEKTTADLDGMTLKEIREQLNNAKALTFRQQGCSFCNKAGAVFNDNLPFSTYIQALNHGSDDSSDKNDNGNGDQEVKPNENPKGATTHYAVYLRSRKLPTELDENTKNFLNEKMEFDLKKTELLAGKSPELLEKSYSHSDFMARTGSGTITQPADMLERHWNVVMNTNSLLSGSSAVLRDVDIGVRVERAMYPAFKSKKREFEDYEVALDNNSDIAVPKHGLHIPRFVVADDSYVEVTESQSSVATAVASSSLAQVDAELAVGAGVYGYSAGISASHHSEEETKKLVTNRTDKKRMVITYNFPRVIVLLDEDSLEVTAECVEAVKKVKDWNTLSIFLNKYGSFFATRVELGGRLHSSEDSTAITGETVSEKAKSMKNAAGLSVSGPAVGVSVKGGKGKVEGNKDENTTSSLESKMSWEAKGGNTLLCNNPPQWCSTVASFYNWRVVKQENILAIEDLIDRIQGGSAVRDQFDLIRKPPPLAPDHLNICFYEKALNKYISLHPDRTDNSLYMRLSADDQTEVFELHGIIPTYGGTRRIMRQHQYTLFNTNSKTWVHGKKHGPVEGMSNLCSGAMEESKWHFKIESVEPEKNTSGVLGQNFAVTIAAFDPDGNRKGLLGQVGARQDDLFVGAGFGFTPRHFLLRYQDSALLRIKKLSDVNAQGGEYGYALYAASYRGHQEIVTLLLDKGADVNAQGGEYGYALYAASYRGHQEIVTLLLDKGADVNAQGGFYGNALQAALADGHQEIATLLLDKGADVNAQGGFYGNALQAALADGHQEIATLLLDKGADVTAAGDRYGNALQAALKKAVNGS
ncbi:hypothetical protein PENARI_c069G05383 [Penicillium arizonense]|uniref:MACPF-like domain-containing protein n=1 Tax=Penicillium arizonense TaxID=1835702 RepID=A0A1F5L1I2_PENAI|nr:hypothetical protein PENARI_c069G05383 [Penicillium arizonense]OGE47064.1 hypothetical protein PENARI_c069G05383 [Penicillium arizonense]